MSAASWLTSSADPASFSNQQLIECAELSYTAECRIHSAVALPTQAVHKSKCINGIALSSGKFGS